MIHKIDKQQGFSVEQKGLYSLSSKNLMWNTVRKIKSEYNQNPLVVQWVGLLFTAAAQVYSLVRNLKSCEPHSTNSV